MLTEEQIERLHRFCVEHYVRHYDVQVELVDHLATAIEEKMSDNHLLSFEQALQQVYRGFGVRGFAGIVQAREEALQRANHRFCLQFIRSFFRWPRLILTLLIASVLALPFTILPSEWTAYFMLGLASVFLLTEFVTLFSFRRYQRPRKDRRLLLLDTGILYPVPVLSAQLFNIYFLFLDISNYEVSRQQYLLFSLCAGFFFMGAVARFQLQKQIMEKARKFYPGAFDPAQ